MYGYNNQIYPSNLATQKTLAYRRLQQNPFRHFLTPRGQASFGKNILFDETLTAAELRTLTEQSPKGLAPEERWALSQTPLGHPFSTVAAETLELSEELFELSGPAVNRMPKTPKKTTFWALSGGTIFIDYFLTFLRNPLFDPGHAHGAELHYETLDKFWDSRPGLAGWLLSDLEGPSRLGGLLFHKPVWEYYSDDQRFETRVERLARFDKVAQIYLGSAMVTGGRSWLIEL